MGAMFKLPRATPTSTHVPASGEVFMQGLPDGSFRTAVGDGVTAAPDLPPLLHYDLHARVGALEEEVKQLKQAMGEAK